eukprot:CAMPEP_0205816946 /NCGR_PEP_ID=MMETSP0205-20121125/23494_1 /ASSEMBLY_ACC=CAM_ASM_000278 /TAXON_ID=36767 /ORGANISM="Euplotes focardii, Strain TN1" /LENGTH=119 /DNA_ID=CAMNT_0053106321 /DNA_START=343 /DNA_END=699 /DNA_ORIENTATION=+
MKEDLAYLMDKNEQYEEDLQDKSGVIDLVAKEVEEIKNINQQDKLENEELKKQNSSLKDENKTLSDNVLSRNNEVIEIIKKYDSLASAIEIKRTKDKVEIKTLKHKLKDSEKEIKYLLD